MRELNSAQQGVAAGSILRLPRPVDFRKGRGCSRLRAEATITVKNNTAGALDFTGAKAKAAAKAAFALGNLAFGSKGQDKVDNGLPFDRARELLIAMTGDDFVFERTGYGPKRMKDVADADVLAAAVGAGASVTFTFEYVRAFEVPRLGPHAFRYCPGARQMEQIAWDFTSAAWGDASFIFGAALDATFIADDFEVHDEKWAAVPRLFQQEESGRKSRGPVGNIGLIAMWEYTGAGAATALTVFSVNRDNDAPVHENARASRVVRDALYNDPVGFYDLNTLATVLVQLPADAEPNDIPTGSGFTFEQTGAELAPPKTAWCYVPGRTKDEHDALVGSNVSRPEDGPVVAISAATKSGTGLHQSVAALEPVVLAAEGSDDAAVLPGRRYANGQAPTDVVPAGIVRAAEAAVQAAGGGSASGAAASKAASAIAKAIPGGAVARRGQRSPTYGALASRLRGR